MWEERILLKDIIDEVWKRYHSTYYVVDDPRANVRLYQTIYMAEKAEDKEDVWQTKSVQIFLGFDEEDPDHQEGEY